MSPSRTQLAPAIGLSHASGARAAVYPDGAHLFTWWPSVGSEVLFVAEGAQRAIGVALRGGVPLIFPQFAERGPLPKHGFARTARWETRSRDTMTLLALELRDTPETRAVWPHRFEATYTVTLEDQAVALELAVVNRDDAAFDFTCALHTYLRVGDVTAVALEGLHGRRYLDSADGGAEKIDTEERLRIEGEVNRIYLDTPATLVLHDPSLGRSIAIGADGFRDTVVWNPGPAGEAQLGDLSAGEHRHFLCVESAVVGAPIELAPSARWAGRQVLSLQGTT